MRKIGEKGVSTLPFYDRIKEERGLFKSRLFLILAGVIPPSLGKVSH
jgi:hypothetical protein